MSQGTVKWFSREKGYGFISDGENGGDVFLHFSNVRIDSLGDLAEGRAVEYDVVSGDRGPQAESVRAV